LNVERPTLQNVRNDDDEWIESHAFIP